MSPRKVLVVDDDGSILRLVATILRREQYEVDTASGGRAALAQIEATRYDVIVLDLMMPDVDGLDVLRALRTKIPEAKCVVVMSAGSPLEIASAISPNVYASLRKPFDNKALVDAVRGCLAARCASDDSLDPSRPIATAA